MSDARTVIYLVRHAESAPSEDVPEPAWPLSARGVEQAAALVPVMSALGIRSIYASPYPRAVQTLEPLAAALGLPVSLVDGLRERSLGRIDPGVDHRDVLARCWADPDFAPPMGESNAACTARVAQAIAQLALRHRGDTIAAASHGNALALYLGTLDPGFGFEQWRSMRNPDLFRVVYERDRASWDSERWPTVLAG